MALLTVGAGTLLLGRDLIGLPAALAVDWTLWVVGHGRSASCARSSCRGRATRATRSGVAHAGRAADGVRRGRVRCSPGTCARSGPAGDAGVLLRAVRVALALLAASSLVCASVVGSAARRRPGRARPDAVDRARAARAVDHRRERPRHGRDRPRYAGPAAAVGLGYGLVVWVVAVLWLGDRRRPDASRARPPFGLPWWSFTFPVGTVVTGTSALAARTGLAVLGVDRRSGCTPVSSSRGSSSGRLTARNARELCWLRSDPSCARPSSSR